LCENTGGFL
nr:immunoglobulin heavy chain junction region [Mus musculus]